MIVLATPGALLIAVQWINAVRSDTTKLFIYSLQVNKGIFETTFEIVSESI